jgi:hypothetical protein
MRPGDPAFQETRLDAVIRGLEPDGVPPRRSPAIQHHGPSPRYHRTDPLPETRNPSKPRMILTGIVGPGYYLTAATNVAARGRAVAAAASRQPAYGGHRGQRRHRDGQPAAGSATGGGSAAAGCSGTENKTFGCVPAGCASSPPASTGDGRLRPDGSAADAPGRCSPPCPGGFRHTWRRGGTTPRRR